MKELSLHILDIAQNSVKAKSDSVRIRIDETEDTLSFFVSDNGCGMSREFLARVTDPFTTTRTTRKVGLGLPLLKMAAEQTGGFMTIDSDDSPSHHGTVTTAFFRKNSIDYIPLGDMTETVCTLIQGAPEIDWSYEHHTPHGSVTIDTSQLREVLGDVPLSSPDVIIWVRDSLTEEYGNIKENK